MIPKRIKLVQQTEATCGPACVAMVAGLDLESIVGHIRYYQQGVTNHEMEVLLMRHGLYAEHHEHYRQGKVYILTVPSLNTPGGLHYIVVDARRRPFKTYDPNKGRVRGKEKLKFYSTSKIRGVADVMEIKPIFNGGFV